MTRSFLEVVLAQLRQALTQAHTEAPEGERRVLLCRTMHFWASCEEHIRDQFMRFDRLPPAHQALCEAQVQRFLGMLAWLADPSAEPPAWWAKGSVVATESCPTHKTDPEPSSTRAPEPSPTEYFILRPRPSRSRRRPLWRP